LGVKFFDRGEKAFTNYGFKATIRPFYGISDLYKPSEKVQKIKKKSKS